MGIHDIPAVLAYRFLPFLAHLTLSRKVSPRRRLFAWAFFALMLGLGNALARDLSEILVRAPIAFVYFVLASLLVYELAGVRWSTRFTSVSFLVCAVLFVLFPIVLLRPIATVATVGLGWEAMLSAYSFMVDRDTEPEPPSRKDCIFFILANPCVVYPNRGYETDASSGSRIFTRRLGLGVVTWVAASFVPAAFTVTRGHVDHPYFRFALECAAVAASLYFAHSGLASVQIAFAGLSGHRVPERYVYPFASRSPEEFWHRWNTYVGEWIRRYVFQPSALSIRRNWPRIPGSIAASIAVVISFLCVGGLHDYALRAQGLSTTGYFAAATTVTPIFVGCGVVLIVWHGTAAGLRTVTAGVPLGRAPALAWKGFTWLCFIHLALATIWLIQTGASWQ